MKKFRIWEKNAGSGAAGFSAYLIRLLSQIYELDQEYKIYDNDNIVWIDWINWSNNGHNYHEGDNLNKINSWEYYFINNINTEDALKSIEKEPHDWISSNGLYNGYPPPQDLLWENPSLIKEMNRYVKKYFKPNEVIINGLNQDIEKYKTLAVHCRRSDLAWAHPNLNLGFTEQDFFENTMKVFYKGNFEKIYLATEETTIYEYFINKIPNLILSQQDCYRASQSESLVYNLNSNFRPLHRFLTGKEVLIDIINMSKCNSLLCYISGVASMTTYFNGLKYDKIYYFNNVKNDII